MPSVDDADLMTTAWMVDASFVDPRRETPEHAWLASVAADYGVPIGDLCRALSRLAIDGRTSSAIDVRQGTASRLALLEVFFRLVQADVIQRSALAPKPCDAAFEECA